jgi:hypothetical protein
VFPRGSSRYLYLSMFYTFQYLPIFQKSRPTTIILLSKSNMLVLKQILCAMSIATCTATKLYISSDDGNITTINVTESKSCGIYNQSRLALQPIAFSKGCAPSPSWLQLHSNTLFCGGEGNPTPNISVLAPFRTTTNETLLPLSKITTLNGNVNTAIYGNGTAMALTD